MRTPLAAIAKALEPAVPRAITASLAVIVRTLEPAVPCATKASLAMIALALALAAPCAHAERLADPMRPPGAEAFPSARSAPAAPELQTIVIRPDLRYAVIDGQTVAVGQRIGGALVTRIDETRVLIAGPSGVTELRLFPHVDKHAAIEGPTVKARVRNRDTRVARIEERRMLVAGESDATKLQSVREVDANTALPPRTPDGESK